jgi:uncharacterized Zn-binding protein involved in type VI secretion
VTSQISTYKADIMRKVIRIGDSTSHGGKVISAKASHITVDGLAVACIGDKCTCPFHGDGTIIEGDPNHTIDGIPVAYDGHQVSCGAALQSTPNNFYKV